MPTLFEMVKELHDMILEGEIDSCEDIPVDCNEFEPVKFIIDMFTHLPEDEDSIDECTTEKQRATIRQLWDGYCNDDWQPLDSYL